MTEVNSPYHSVVVPENFDPKGLAQLLQRLRGEDALKAETRATAEACVAVLQGHSKDASLVAARSPIGLNPEERQLEAKPRGALIQARYETAHKNLTQALTPTCTSQEISAILAGIWWWYPYYPLLKDRQ